MISRLPEYYVPLIKSVSILPDWTKQIELITNKIVNQKDYYDNYVLPWWVIGCIHALECNSNLRCQILNGERWDKKTTVVPIGVGPWTSFIESTKYALQNYNSHTITSLPQGLLFLEHWNGMGYAKRNKNSPYIWSGTNHGVGVGKYRSDGVYDPTEASSEVGCMAIVLKLNELNLIDKTLFNL